MERLLDRETGCRRAIASKGFPPQMHADVAGVDRLSGMIIGCAFRVMNGLGAGFAEKVYENALAQR
jgi:hypothetical protein